MENKKKTNKTEPASVVREKPKNFKKTIKQLMTYLSEYKLAILIVIIFAIGSAAFSIVGPKILGDAVTELFKGFVSKIMGTGEGIDFNVLGKSLLFLLSLYVISMIFLIIQNFVMSKISTSLAFKLRQKISRKINKLPMKFFDKKNNGEVLSIIINDVDTISQNLNQSLTEVISSFVTVIGVIIMMLTISVELTLVSMLVIPVSLVMMAVIIKNSQKHFKNQQEYLGHINGKIEETYAGHVIVKAFNGEEKVINEFEETNETLYNSSWKSQFLSGIMMPLMTFIGNLGYVIVSIFGGYLAIQGKIQIGSILSFTQYIRNFTRPLSQVAQVANLIQALTAASERVFEFLDEEEEINDYKEELNLSKIKGNVEFKNVHFGYDDEIVIKNFSTKVSKGSKIAIVGPTGAGKTTIVKLLMRFYDLNSGEILIDNKNIKDIDRDKLRSIFGMVLQDTWLFNGSIKDNIRYSKLSASDKEVETAAKAARVDHFIHTLPDSYDMVLNEEGSNISAGQKQLLTIARVILADPKILILDEATSSVDTRTEILIQEAMDLLMKNRTSFVIAHRLSTVKNADLILVLNEGDVVEQGKHEELLEKKGFYANLYNSQFEVE
jgi:ATP-binding cassette subfamily B protein